MQCIQCKGKGLCGLPRCPIMSRILAQATIKHSASYWGRSICPDRVFVLAAAQHAHPRNAYPENPFLVLNGYVVYACADFD